MFDLPSPKNISNSFFELTRPDVNLINEETATYEGVVDEERNVALVQWSQFIEHDLVRTVFQIMSMLTLYCLYAICQTKQSIDFKYKHFL